MKPFFQPYEPIDGIDGITFLASFPMDCLLKCEQTREALLILPRDEMALWAYSMYPFSFHILFSIKEKALWELSTSDLETFGKIYPWFTNCETIPDANAFYQSLNLVIQAPVKAGLTDHWLNWDCTYLNPNYP